MAVASLLPSGNSLMASWKIPWKIMENPPFVDDFPIASINKGYPSATLDYRRLRVSLDRFSRAFPESEQVASDADLAAGSLGSIASS